VPAKIQTPDHSALSLVTIPTMQCGFPT